MSQFDFDDTDDEQDEPTGPQVVWTLDLDDAELLHHYLHHERPGGYQHVHDGLREAIFRAKQSGPSGA